MPQCEKTTRLSWLGITVIVMSLLFAVALKVWYKRTKTSQFETKEIFPRIYAVSGNNASIYIVSTWE